MCIKLSTCVHGYRGSIETRIDLIDRTAEEQKSYTKTLNGLKDWQSALVHRSIQETRLMCRLARKRATLCHWDAVKNGQALPQ